MFFPNSCECICTHPLDCRHLLFPLFLEVIVYWRWAKICPRSHKRNVKPLLRRDVYLKPEEQRFFTSCSSFSASQESLYWVEAVYCIYFQIYILLNVSFTLLYDHAHVFHHKDIKEMCFLQQQHINKQRQTMKYQWHLACLS